MPLQSGSSRAAFEHNVRAEVAAGKPQRQAVAIAYSKKSEDAWQPKPLPKGVSWWKITYAIHGDESRTNVSNVKAKNEEDARVQFFQTARGQPKILKIERTSDSLSSVALDALDYGGVYSDGSGWWMTWNSELHGPFASRVEALEAKMMASAARDCVTEFLGEQSMLRKYSGGDSLSAIARDALGISDSASSEEQARMDRKTGQSQRREQEKIDKTTGRNSRESQRLEQERIDRITGRGRGDSLSAIARDALGDDEEDIVRGMMKRWQALHVKQQNTKLRGAELDEYMKLHNDLNGNGRYAETRRKILKKRWGIVGDSLADLVEQARGGIRGQTGDATPEEVRRLRKELADVDSSKPGALKKYDEILARLEKAENELGRSTRQTGKGTFK